MSWNNVFVLELHHSSDRIEDRQIIMDATDAYTEKYGVPKERRWTNDLIRGAKLKYLKLPPPGSPMLNTIKLEDKLMIVGHGTKKDLAGLSGEGLAKLLSEWGLQAVGLVTFKACHVGREKFLDEFIAGCTKHTIKAGWAKGYNGSAATTSNYHEEIFNPNYDDSVPDFLNEMRGQGEFLTGAARYRIVKGNAAGQIAERKRYKH